ncbi:hypothetical protein AX769_04850 [Frondihabitans sp. PAMC 28766]|uniref:hypothetical protein n=1 Tax=Frondihabitans sp. PAMC 28766 TaxID=1795630 RepID=UPI00078DA676|nr:hypothetical protein [Frondihabitans sp. PAMC 28766]AMM19590.1 hypothetical protein AX769_04850 [Frondihabitans sp. PAMC 28766]
MHRPLPSLLLGAPFTLADGRSAGVERGRLAADDLLRPHHGVRNVAAPKSIVGRCEELLPLLGAGQAFSHVTAAALWGLPLPLAARSAPLHETSPDGRRPRRPGVVGHRSNGVGGTFMGGLPVVEPAWAWAQCSELLGLDDLVAMGDGLAGRWSKDERARERPLDELDVAVSTWGSRRGARKLRKARHLVRADVWSPKETELRLLIVRAGLPEPPEPNGEVTNAAGGALGHADLVYRDERVVLEYEGDGHRSDRAQWRKDIARYERFQDAGWRVIRVTDDDLVSSGLLLHRLDKELRLRACNI